MPEQAIPAEQESAAVDSVNQPPADDASALRAKLELVQRDNLAKGEANRSLNERLGESEKRLRDLESQLKATNQQSLESNGEYKQLWQDASAENGKLMQRISELEGQLQQRDQAISAERLKANTINKLSAANAISPEQLYGLLQPQLRDSNGQPAVIVNGIEQPLDNYLETLKGANSGWEHHFAATTGAMGMGSRTTSSVGESPANPFKKETFNMTEALLMEANNPDQAKRLRAEAGLG
jgi:hypothetical protein